MIARGANARAVRIGDRVFGIVGGGVLADRVLVHQRHVVAVPPNLDDIEAAAVPEVFITAHDAVFTLGRLRLGELLVVTGANGGVGTAASRSARPPALACSRPARRERRERVAELGAEVIAPERSRRAATSAGGADVVLELVGAPNLARDFGALGMKGRIVIVGTGAGADADALAAALMGKRARLIGTMLRARPLEEKAAAVQAFGREVVPLLATGRSCRSSTVSSRPTRPRRVRPDGSSPASSARSLLDFGSRGQGRVPRALPAEPEREGGGRGARRPRCGSRSSTSSRAGLDAPPDAVPGARLRRRPPVLVGAGAGRYAALPRSTAGGSRRWSQP